MKSEGVVEDLCGYDLCSRDVFYFSRIEFLVVL